MPVVQFDYFFPFFFYSSRRIMDGVETLVDIKGLAIGESSD